MTCFGVNTVLEGCALVSCGTQPISNIPYQKLLSCRAFENIEARRSLRVTRRTHVSTVPRGKTLLLSSQGRVSLLVSLAQRLRLHHMLFPTVWNMSLSTLSKTNALRASLRATSSHARTNKNCRCSCVK